MFAYTSPISELPLREMHLIHMKKVLACFCFSNLFRLLAFYCSWAVLGMVTNLNHSDNCFQTFSLIACRPPIFCYP